MGGTAGTFRYYESCSESTLTSMLCAVLIEHADPLRTALEGAVGLTVSRRQVLDNHVIDGDERRVPAATRNTAIEPVLGTVGTSCGGDFL